MSAADAVRVLLVDDNALIRVGLRQVLEPVADIEVVAEAANGQEALEAADRFSPDVALVDVKMPVMDGLTLVERLRDHCRVVMLTNSDDARTITEALTRGACGYLVHGTFDPTLLAQVVRDAAAGAAMLSPGAATVVLDRLREAVDREPVGGRDIPGDANDDLVEPLSAREREVMDLIAAGLSNPEIAARLYLSQKTVKNHINRIFTKVGATTRGEAIAGWVGTRAPRGPAG